jgi:plasmid stabilization system protein ParE
MTRTNLRVHSQAQDEINEAFEWYFKRSHEAADAFLGEIGKSLNRIVSGPRRFPLFTKSTRRLVLHGFPYTVIFREKDETILVIAVSHAKRRPGYWKMRV